MKPMFRRILSNLNGIACLACAAAVAPHAAIANPWSDVGTPSRPGWVDQGAERRLRLLNSLPGIHTALKNQAMGYIGNMGPGLSVGLVLDDGLFYSQGFGFADAAKTVVPDETTIFRAGSLSKVITGTALLTLIDDPARNMSLDDAADKAAYLPELKFVCPVWGSSCQRGLQVNSIKLKHLVSHTAGLANVMEQTNAHVPVWLADLQKSWLLFPPGTASAYSGVSAEAEGLIGQRVSGQLYVDYVKSSLFTPLAMNASSMDEQTLPAARRAQKWQFGGPSGPQAWTFTKFNGILAGDDQPMILPAGGLATTVFDLSRFIAIFLLGPMPQVNGHPLLKPTTITSAGSSMFSSVAPPPPHCAGASSNDANGFSYSRCGTAFGFGVNWYVGTPPYIQHNGDEPGLSGSNTVFDQTAKMGATGLISTEPFPALVPQPAGLDKNFMTTVVMGLLTSGKTADAATDWTGQLLADGIARLLYLSGKAPAASDINAFRASFIATNHLNAGNVVAFLNTWHNAVGSCSTFRVRHVRSTSSLGVSFRCKKSTWNVVIDVDASAPHKVSWSNVPPDPVALQKCINACNVAEGACMSQAHSVSEKQQCIADKKECVKECG